MQKPNLKPSLRDRIFGNAKRIAPEKEMIMIHHILMKEYGWIPLEELTGKEKETYMKYEIPVVINKRREGWKGRLKDIFCGVEQEIKLIECEGKLLSTKDGAPMDMIMDLIECIRKEAEQMERNMQSSKRRRGRR